MKTPIILLSLIVTVFRNHTFLIGIKHSAESINSLNTLHKNVSDPDHKDYTQFPSQQELCRLLEPSVEAVVSVHSFILEQGGFNIRINECKDSIQFEHSDTEADYLSILKAFKQSGLKQYVDYFDGYHNRNIHRKMAHNLDFTQVTQESKNHLIQSLFRKIISQLNLNQNSEKGDEHYTNVDYPKCLKDQTDPVCLKQAYNVSSIYNTIQNPLSQQAVGNFGADFYKPTDIASFLKSFKLAPTTILDKKLNKPTYPGLESTIDLEMLTGMANGVPTQFWHYDCTKESCHPFMSLLTDLNNQTDADLPKVLSVSVGVTEHEYLDELGPEYADRVDTELQKLGARGCSVLFAIGDRATQTYKDKIWINFPASSPNLTAVGGVSLGDLAMGPMAVSNYSTGGFSQYFAQPEYQKSFVQNWMTANNVTKLDGVDLSKRAVPDVVAFSAFYNIFKDGDWTWAGGTSCSAPVVAGMVSVLNEARMKAGMNSLGFLNPFLYKNADCMMDIVLGSNQYDAVKGWDPASGLGTLDFSCLIERALKK